MVVCPKCNGTLHLRISGTDTFRRCDCTRSVLSLSYIRDEVRAGETVAPPQTTPILPLRDVFVCQPSLTDFRHWVWHSLLVYEQQSLVYVYTHGQAVINAYFDSENVALADMQDAPLFIFVGGISEVLRSDRSGGGHSLLGPLLLQTLKIRAQRGQPTWVYMPSLEMARGFYGTEAVTYLQSLWGRDRPVLASPSQPYVDKPARTDALAT